MKTWFLSLFIFPFVAVSAQQVNNYKYIVIPKDFSDFKNNENRLKNILNYELKEKNYHVLTSNEDSWPQEVKENKCLALTSDIKKIKSTFKNKVDLEFYNCKNKLVQNFEGVSSIKEYEPGYQDAVKKATQNLLKSNPIDIKEEYEVKDTPKEIKTQNEVVVTNTSNNTINTTSKQYLKLDLKDGSFAFLNAANNQIIATFYPTKQSNIFRVTVNGSDASKNYSSVGYIIDGIYRFEYLDNNNNWQEEKINIK